GQQRQGRQNNRVAKLGCYFVLQENGGHTDPYRAKGCAIKLQRSMHFVHGCRAVYDLELPPKMSIADEREIRPGGNHLANKVRIRVKKSLVVVVNNGDVVDDEPAPDYGLHHVVEIDVLSQAVGNSGANC